jgi:integrase/recombinase XerC
MKLLTEGISEFLTSLIAERNFSELTVTTYRGILKLLAIRYPEYPVDAVSLNDLKVFILEYVERTQSKFNNQYKIVATLRSFFHYCLVNGYTNRDVSLGLNFPKRDKHIPQVLTEQDINTIFDVAKDLKQLSLRDVAVVSLLYFAGLRISELCEIKIADIDLGNSRILIHGKGKRERIIPIADNLKLALVEYLKLILPIEKVWLFPSTKISAEHIQTRAIRYRIEYLALLAGIDGVFPHKFRATFATRLHDSDEVDILELQELLGHSSSDTTAMYTKIPMQNKIKGVNTL